MSKKKGGKKDGDLV